MKRIITLLIVMLAFGMTNAQIVEKKLKTSAAQKKSVESVNLSALDMNSSFVVSPAFVKKASGMPVFSEGFETATGGAFPTGWTSIATPGGNAWTTNAIPTSTGSLSAHSGSKYAGIIYNETVAHNAWLFSPSINMTAGKEYVISFWLRMQGYNGGFEKLDVKIGNAATVAGMTTQLFTNTTQDYGAWTLITKTFTPTTSGSYYLGFHSYSPNDLFYTAIDDISVTTPFDNDLTLVFNYPYTQVPVSQMLPPAKAKNSGTETQTNVKLSAMLNGSSVGSSTSIASLTPGSTSAEMSIDPPVNVVLGNNALDYVVSADETDENPVDNTSSIAFNGTLNLFAVDKATFFTNGIGNNTSTVSFGNIYNITSAVTLSQVAVGFGASATLNYSIALYSMSNDTTIIAEPLFTQTATRNIKGLSVINIPATTLTPGNYFLCVNQLTTTNISISYDSVSNKNFYLKDGNILRPVSGFGSVAVRMIMEVSDCHATPPTNLTVVPNYTSADFSWEGDALSYILKIKTTDDTLTFLTGSKNITISNLPMGTDFTWDVKSACDATHYTDSIEGQTFTTLSCATINAFPWSYGFEDGAVVSTPCWPQEQVSGQVAWARAEGNGDNPASAHTGTYDMIFKNNNKKTPDVTKLITPRIDITTLTTPALRFWHTQEKWENDQDELRVYYKNSASGTWTLLAEYTNNIPDWREELLPLPNGSDDYYIAFEGTAKYGYGIALDDIEIYNHTAGPDMAVISVNKPVSDANLSATEEVSVTVKNFSSSSVASVPVKLEVNGTVVATETITATISYLSEYTYTFAAKADLSVVQTHAVKVSTELTDDEKAANDTLTKEVTNYGNIAIIKSDSIVTTCNIPFVDDGVYEDYISGEGVVQKMTFKPSTVGDRLKVTFNEFNSVPYQLFLGMFPIPGDTLFVYQGTTTANSNNLLGYLTGSLDAQLPTFMSYSEDGALTFVFKKNSGSNASGWKADIECITPLAYDAKMLAIVSPTIGGSSSATVKVNIQNLGLNAITSMNVAYSVNGGTPVVESFTGNIVPGQITSFSFGTPVNVSTYNMYRIKAYTDLTGDMNHNNDTATTSISYQSPVKLYGYRIYEDNNSSPKGFVSFMSNNPTTVTVESTYTDGSNNLSGGVYYSESLYAFTRNNSGPANFISFTKNWTQTATHPSTISPSDVAFDYSTNTLYAIIPNSETQKVDLYTVDINTGEATFSKELDQQFLTLACSGDGQLYGVSRTSNFYAINKTTGVSSLIGATGISAPSYLQSMAFDYPSGRLFWAYCNDSEGKLIEIDVATGAGTSLGLIGGNSEIVMLYTPYDFIGINTVSLNNRDIKVYPNPVTDKITIENATGLKAKIYDVSGKILLETKIQNAKEIIDLRHLNTGIYFIDLQDKNIKTTSKLIKK